MKKTSGFFQKAALITLLSLPDFISLWNLPACVFRYSADNDA